MEGREWKVYHLGHWCWWWDRILLSGSTVTSLHKMRSEQQLSQKGLTARCEITSWPRTLPHLGKGGPFYMISPKRASSTPPWLGLSPKNFFFFFFSLWSMGAFCKSLLWQPVLKENGQPLQTGVSSSLYSPARHRVGLPPYLMNEPVELYTKRQ